ncbi:MAG: hypothetical protein R2751_05455 [Bacteroidales bacterium]
MFHLSLFFGWKPDSNAELGDQVRSFRRLYLAWGLVFACFTLAFMFRLLP